MVGGKRCSYLNDISQKYLALHCKPRSRNIVGNYIYLLIEKLIVTAELEERIFENEKKRLTSQETPKLIEVLAFKKKQVECLVNSLHYVTFDINLMSHLLCIEVPVNTAQQGLFRQPFRDTAKSF